MPHTPFPFPIRGTVIEQVNQVLQHAIESEASDIHIEPYEHALRARFRLDGVLYVSCQLPVSQKDAIISRIKILAGLDIAEKRRPQDGKIAFTYKNQTYDLRVSTTPTRFGEKVVLRILDRRSIKMSLEEVGMDHQDLVWYRNIIRKPYGMVLVTGPTGSGKTTTLYASLNELNTEQVNILTIEDPIEYELMGINQTQVHPEIGLTFSSALRAFLRQDPDIIMVGEIRDQETAEMSIRAALTGHMVFSTLHTNDATSAISRLLDMGIEPFLITSSLTAIVAQRLVRRICSSCKTWITETNMPRGGHWRGAGCDRCNGRGYRGRIPVFEILPVTEPLQELIMHNAGLSAIRAFTREASIRTLHEYGQILVAQGITTPDEILRETNL